MSNQVERYTNALRSLEQAERSARENFVSIIKMAASTGAPAWLVKRHNAKADGINTEIISLYRTLLGLDPTTKAPILVPRFVLTIAPLATTIDAADAEILGLKQLMAVNYLKPGRANDADPPPPEQLGAGLIPVMVVGGIVLVAGGSKIIGMLRAGRGTDAEIAKYGVFQQYHDNEAKRIAAVNAFMARCAGADPSKTAYCAAEARRLYDREDAPSFFSSWSLLHTLGVVAVAGAGTYGVIWWRRRARKQRREARALRPLENQYEG